MKRDLQDKLDQLFEQFMNGKIGRRDFLKYVGIAGAAAGLVGGPFGFSGPVYAAKSIRFDGWGDPKGLVQ